MTYVNLQTLLLHIALTVLITYVYTYTFGVGIHQGTLTPIVKNPKDAVPPEGLIEALERLCADKRNIVYIISGRDGSFLQKHLGSISGLGMSAEHGCFLREPGGKEWIDLTENIDMSWMDDVEEIFKCWFTFYC